MMPVEEIRVLKPSEAEGFVRIVGMAYPRQEMQVPDMKERWINRIRESMQEDPGVSFVGCFRDNRMVGVMKWFDFHMNVHGKRLLTGGIGTVAVDLLHKKEKIAKSMLLHFLRAYRDRGVSLVSLYPFRVDFYKQMGFGAGTKMNEYRVSPLDLPAGSKQDVIALSKEDRADILGSYNRYAAKTHGMIEKTARELDAFLDRPEHIAFGCRKDGQLSGYLVLQFKQVRQENASIHDLHVKEFICETPEAMRGLLAFLRSQADQVRRCIFYTQEEDFHFLLADPGNGSDRLIPFYYHESHASGVGLMYRMIDVAGYFRQMADHRMGRESCTLTFHIRDSFLPDNEKSYTICFRDGLPGLLPETPAQADAEVSLDISDFSSLVMGAVRFHSLYQYGLAHLSRPEYVEVIDRLFAVPCKPRCTTGF
ncbi:MULTISPECIES: GNAT family N-acetyltransferase [Brevibacillus]|uniref:GNAT family N-acetyltransferase n=1 Tax=Brevibacillus TaxID=55080 RepID=UPI000ABF01F7|nr:GNAT family N-acetyltransferase [Brevibacillus borstelensis]MED1743074.1 GNAT family N-acetyltransferase [Brevibacillus borstelensis]MED1884084.1 GNAT family N-acetyltransferase [Brevibacillus borstelensis]